MNWLWHVRAIVCVLSFAPLPLHPTTPVEEVQARLREQEQLRNGFTPEFWPGSSSNSIFPFPARSHSGVVEEAAELHPPPRILPDVYQLDHKPAHYVVKPLLAEAIAIPSPGRMKDRGYRTFHQQEQSEQSVQQQSDIQLEQSEGEDVEEERAPKKAPHHKGMVHIMREQVVESEQSEGKPDQNKDVNLDQELAVRFEQLITLLESLSTKTDTIESKLGDVHTSELEERLDKLLQSTEAITSKTDELESKIDELSSTVSQWPKPARGATERLGPEQSPMRARKNVGMLPQTESVSEVLNKILRYLNGELVTLPQEVRDERHAELSQKQTQQPQPSHLPTIRELGVRHGPNTVTILELKRLARALKKKEADLAVLSQASSLIKAPSLVQSPQTAPSEKSVHFVPSHYRQPEKHQMLLQRASKTETPKKKVSPKPRVQKPKPPKLVSEWTEEEVQREQEADLLREEREEHDWVNQKSPV